MWNWLISTGFWLGLATQTLAVLIVVCGLSLVILTTFGLVAPPF